MKLGVIFPQTEIGSDPVALKDYAQAVEGMGYHYLSAYEHVLGANPNRPGGWSGFRPYTFEHSFHEPFVLFGYLAGFTKTLEFVTGILVLPQRTTALVAKQAAQVDILSGGRLRLGVGVGWNDVEYRGMGAAFKDRGRRIEEQVALLRELWTKPLVTFTGRDHTLPDVGLNPLPVQRPIPIWFGGMAEAVLRRMARLGDGWMPGGSPGPKLAAMIDRLRGYLAKAGRSPAEFGIDGRLNFRSAPPETWGTQVEQWRQLGATHLAVNTMGAGLKSPQAHIDAIRQFKVEVEG
ncbi:MAG: LLM class F420-dependent oxidoreductase [Anaerolineae bacterium]